MTFRISQLTDLVFLGSYHARDPLLLAEKKIKHVLCIMTQWEYTTFNLHPVPPEMESVFYLDDSDTNTNLHEVISAAVQELESHVARGEAVLVHCQAGISRSPTVVLAWMMKQRRLSFDDALQELRQVRQHIKPNETFCTYLKTTIQQ